LSSPEGSANYESGAQRYSQLLPLLPFLANLEIALDATNIMDYLMLERFQKMWRSTLDFRFVGYLRVFLVRCGLWVLLGTSTAVYT
jgi:hypothetical protein